MTTLRLSVKRLYADVNGRQLHTRMIRPAADQGRPPVLCLHLSPSSGRIYEAVMEDLGRDRIVLAPDTPGFGNSDRPDSLPTLEGYADAMMALTDELGIEGPFDLFGYHTGSRTSVLLANRYPQRVRRIMTVAMAIRTPQELAASHVEFGPAALSEDGSHLSRAWTEFLHWNRIGGASLEDAADAFPCHLLGRAEAWWGHHAAFGFSLHDALPKVRQPLVVLNPTDDLTELTARCAPYLANGVMLDVPNWGHSFLDSHTADAARLMRSFFDAPDDAPFSRLDPGSGAG